MHPALKHQPFHPISGGRRALLQDRGLPERRPDVLLQTRCVAVGCIYRPLLSDPYQTARTNHHSPARLPIHPPADDPFYLHTHSALDVMMQRSVPLPWCPPLHIFYRACMYAGLAGWLALWATPPHQPSHQPPDVTPPPIIRFMDYNDALAHLTEPFPDDERYKYFYLVSGNDMAHGLRRATGACLGRRRWNASLGQGGGDDSTTAMHPMPRK
jgi:hypothetical protein